MLNERGILYALQMHACYEHNHFNSLPYSYSYYLWEPNFAPQNSIVTDEDLRGRNTLHFNLFPLLRECSTTAYSYLCRSNEPLSIYQILLYLQSELNSQNFIHMICLTCSVKPISAGSLKALFATVGILVSHGIALLLQSKLMVTFLTLTACFQTKSHHL